MAARNCPTVRANPHVLATNADAFKPRGPMPHSSEQMLDAIQAALTTQNQQFAAFVETFNALPPGTHLDVSPAVLDAIEATATGPHVQAACAPIGGLRA